ncbi:MAG: hypothetical protein B7Z58_14690, partial [Acidiphilium sp. 37-64-53]
MGWGLLLVGFWCVETWRAEEDVATGVWRWVRAEGGLGRQVDAHGVVERGEDADEFWVGLQETCEFGVAEEVLQAEAGEAGFGEQTVEPGFPARQ